VTQTDARFDVEPSVSNHFAWIRTLLGLQRTLMAAVRTSISLIGFGFTVAQFFERLRSSAPGGEARLGPQAPRDFGLLLIATGVVSLAVFTWQYRSVVIYLRSGPFAALTGPRAKPMRTSIYLIAVTVMLIGVVAFASVFIRF
jgi:putative membrane protein